MQPELSSAPHPSPRPSLNRPTYIRPHRFRRWSLPLLAAIAIIGYRVTTQPLKQGARYQIAEEERLRKNQELMDAYGYKDNVSDLQKALEAYEIQ
ncbi:hypothetical protein BDW59DRAFT_158641 [Aspergillus cavernicola]|uniref:Uncharacterized protein n=1 Tax=Aspergillus cavernicola TaxID=176166 RepID=A0ABR4IRU5_9EURO